MSVVCHHPELAVRNHRYSVSTPEWWENGKTIFVASEAEFTADTSADLTTTTLTINITVGHFRNKSFDYLCVLALAMDNGLPSGEVDISGIVTVRPYGEYFSQMYTVCI